MDDRLPVAILKVDIVESSTLEARLGAEAARECLILVHDIVETASTGFDCNSCFSHSDGDGTSIYFGGKEAVARSVHAAMAAVERVRTLPKYEVSLRAAIGIDVITGDWTKAYSHDFNRAGHAVSADVCPPNGVCLTEDAMAALSEQDPRTAEGFEYIGTTERDAAAIFAWPKGKKPSKPRGLRMAGKDTFPVRRSLCDYYLRPPFSQLRFYGLPQFNFVGALDLMLVFTPVKLRLLQGEFSPSLAKEEKASIPEGRMVSEIISVSETMRRNRNLVILGEPGAGKTTLLRYLAMVAAAGRWKVLSEIGLDERLVPVFTSASALIEARKNHQSVGPHELLGIILGAHVGISARELMPILDGAETVLYLVDGLDELPHAQDRADAAALVMELASGNPRARCLVTSRPMGYPGIHLPDQAELEMESLDAGQSRTLARAFYREFYRASKYGETEAERLGTDKGNRLASALEEREDLALFARNPLLLSLAALVHVQLGELPKHRVKLYEVAAQTLVDSWARARRAVEASSDIQGIDYETEGRAVLEPLAYRIHSDCPGGAIEDRELIKLIEERLPNLGGKARNFLDRLKRAGAILVERGPGRWGFAHLTFQEFFAAAHIISEEQQVEETLLRIYDPRWEKVIRFAAAQLSVLQNRQKATSEMIRAMLYFSPKDFRSEILSWNLLLAAQCLADTVCHDETLQTQIIEKMVPLMLEPSAAWLPQIYRTVREIRNSWLAELLSKNLMETLSSNSPLNVDKKPYSAEALGRLGAREAIPLLIKALREDPFPEVRKSAAAALANLPAMEAIPELIKTLRDDQDQLVRWIAGIALEELTAREAISVFIQALHDDPDVFVRSWAAEALGRFSAKEAIPDLMKALSEDKESEVRLRVAEALRVLDAKESVPELIEILGKDPDPSLRSNAARVLGRLGAKDAIPTLIKIIYDDQSLLVRLGAAEALGTLGERDVLPDLIAVLHKDPVDEVRSEAAEALGKLGAKEAIPDLIGVLRNDKSLVVQVEVVRALGRVGAREAIADLMKILRDDSRVFDRYNAARALAGIGAREAIPDLIKILRDDKNTSLWRIAVESLGELKAREAVPDIIKMFGNEQGPREKRLVRLALWKIAVAMADDEEK